MLQSVLQALPTYSMSCFKLPLSLCKRITSVLTRFWWDNSPDKRKMAWVAWTKLTRPKNHGGLGFRDIEKFNGALLGKLSWRILKEPESLLGQVLRGKYFPDGSCLVRQPQNNSSHGWQSILSGFEVLNLGMGYIVGDGKDIPIWSSPWLSTSEPITPVGPPTYENQTLTVDDLLDPSTLEWDLSKIRLHLPLYEDRIRLLVPSSFGKKDKLVWLLEKTGNYTSKSGYRAVTTPHILNPPEQSFNWLQHIWKIDSSPKLKYFLWRTVVGAIPSGEALASRGIVNETLCCRCKTPESTLHIFWNCPFAKDVWESAPFALDAQQLAPQNMKQLLASCSKYRLLPPVGITASHLSHWILWNLWKARNLLIFEKKLFSATEVLTKAIQEAKEWESVCRRSQHAKSPQPAKSPQVNQVLSCFTDGAWNETSKTGGMGWVFKDPTGMIQAKGSSNRPFVASALVAESLAVKAALQEASTRCIEHLQVFSDSCVLISALRSGTDVNEIAGILYDIQSLATLFSSLSFTFVSRGENHDADELAKAALLLLQNSGTVCPR